MLIWKASEPPVGFLLARRVPMLNRIKNGGGKKLVHKSKAFAASGIRTGGLTRSSL
jgi:hypothetical protein